MPGIADRVIFRTLLVIVLLSPIPFGSIYPWSYMLMGTLAGALVLAWTVKTVLAEERPPVSLARIWFIALPYGLVLLWIGLQMASWTPESWHHPLWRTAAEVLDMQVAGRITVSPVESGTGLMRYLAYGGIFWLALQYGRDARNARTAFLALALAGGVYAAYGLVIEFTGAKMVLWYEKTDYTGMLTSTFRYKNAYATYAGLGILAALGLLLQGAKDIANHTAGPRETLHRFASSLMERGWVLVTALVLMSAALLMSQSRAGFLSVSAAVVLLFVAATLTRGRRLPYARSVVAAFAVSAFGLTLITGQATLDRLSAVEMDKDLRAIIYETTERAIADAPWLGTGAATFDEMFQVYRPPSLPRPVIRAHNSYLENAFELGVPAMVLLVATVLGVAGLCLSGTVTRRRHELYPCVGLGAAGLAALHSAVDFTLQEPAVTATLALVLGVACAQSWSSVARD